MFMEQGVSSPFTGPVLQLGRQDIYSGEGDLEEAAIDSLKKYLIV